MLEHHVVVTVCLTVLMSIVHCVSLSKKALRFFHIFKLLQIPNFGILNYSTKQYYYVRVHVITDL